MVMRASAKVVAVRVALLAIAVAGVAVAFVAHRGGDASARRGQAAATHAYACPMHAQVVAPVPGECPICRMALELQQSAAQAGPAPGPAGSARGATFSLPPRTARLNDDDHVIAKRRRVSGPIVAPASIDGDRGGFVLLYEGDAVAGQQARFQPAARPAAAAGIDVRFTSEPPLRQDGGVVKMRFALAAGASPPSPGETGWLAFERREVDAVTVPHAAILETPEGAFAFVVSADRLTYTKRSVDIGSHFAGQAVVLSGVNEGERVAVSKGFVLATEQQLGEASGARAEARP